MNKETAAVSGEFRSAAGVDEIDGSVSSSAAAISGEIPVAGCSSGSGERWGRTSGERGV